MSPICRRWMLLALSPLALLCASTLSLPDTSFTAVNWSLASPSAIAAAQKKLIAPIGCICVHTSGGGCPFFDCPCTCDLTAGACDPFCCCDAECTADHVITIQHQGLCEDALPIRPSIEYCSTDLSLATVAASGVNPLLADSVLCVAVDNNEVVGDYLTTPAEQSMAVASAFLQNAKSYSFLSATTSSHGSSSSAPDPRDLYQAGDSIPVFTRSPQTASHGPVLVGWAAAAGATRCSQRNPVRFLIDWADNSCVVDDLELHEVCQAMGGPLDSSAVASGLLVAKYPSVPSASSTSKQVVAVEVTVQQIDLATGETIQLEPPYPAYYPEPRLTNAASGVLTCEGSLFGVAYTVYHNGSGLIERVEAVVTVGDLFTSSNSSSFASIRQSFSVRFVSTATISRSIEQGNLQTYERSGNPGYQLHHPVRVGVLRTSANESLKNTPIVAEMAGGLTLSSFGDCDYPLKVPVLFGEDLHLSCTLALNSSAFRAFCERDSPVVADSLRVGFTQIARFGNSDALLADEWLPIDYDEPTKTTTTFVDATGAGTVEIQCENVLSSLHWEFLVAAVGPVNNPQNKIVAARATHGKDTWTFWNNPQDSAKQETYLLTATVSFVKVQTTQLDQWIPPTPPIWFSIPNDVFYPFILSGSSRIGPGTFIWTTWLWLWLTWSLAWVGQ